LAEQCLEDGEPRDGITIVDIREEIGIGLLPSGSLHRGAAANIDLHNARRHPIRDLGIKFHFAPERSNEDLCSLNNGTLGGVLRMNQSLGKRLVLEQARNVEVLGAEGRLNAGSGVEYQWIILKEFWIGQRAFAGFELAPRIRIP
jgi:hypothetical protein